MLCVIHARTTFDPYPKMMKMALTSFSPHYGIIGIIKDAINTLGLGTRNLNLGGHFVLSIVIDDLMFRSSHILYASI